MHASSAEGIGLDIDRCCGVRVQVPVPDLEKTGLKREGKCRPNGSKGGMTTDLCGVSFHLIDDVDLIGATQKHLSIDQRRKIQKGQFIRATVPSRR